MTDPPEGDHPRRCTATANSTGERCKRWAIKGSNVCPTHGGSAGQTQAKAQQRLLEAAVPAVAALRDVVDDEAASDGDKIRAAKAILDRVPETTRAERRELVGDGGGPIEEHVRVELHQITTEGGGEDE